MTSNTVSKEQSSPTTSSPGKVKSTLVGLLGLLVVFASLYFLYISGIYIYNNIYNWIYPPPPVLSPQAPLAASVSLSAYFKKTYNGLDELVVAGAAQQSGKPVNEGKVQLTVKKRDRTFHQSAMIDLDAGKFEASSATVPSFKYITRSEPIDILAEVWLVGLNEKRLTAEVNLDVRESWRTLVLANYFWHCLIFLLFVLGWTFLAVFTGKRTPAKNRWAIIISYVVITLVLSLTIVAPIILPLWFPDSLEDIVKTPVGLLVAKIDKETPPQWVLNIGGNIKYIQDTGNLSSPPITEVEGGLIIPLYVLILSIIGGAINMTRQIPALQHEGERAESITPKTIGTHVIASIGGLRRLRGNQRPNARPGNPPTESQEVRSMLTVSAQALRVGVDQLAQQMIDETAPAENPRRVAVVDFTTLQNGTNDLGRYVASRLTACLAKSQKFFVVERQRLEQVLAESQSSMSDFVEPTKAKELAETLDVDTIVVGTVLDLGNNVGLNARLIEVETSRVLLSETVSISEDEAIQDKDWRIELLNQYMYLIGAPFLAIVTFYLLLWLNLNRVPLVVLVSFSVGLISAPILSRITGVASKVIQTEPPSGRRSDGSTLRNESREIVGGIANPR